MKTININLSNSGLDNKKIYEYQNKINKILDKFKSNESGLPLGWLKYPENKHLKEIEEIKEEAKKIKQKCEAFVVIGIGGSYLGAKAVIDMLTPNFNENSKTKIYYVGNNLNADYINELIEEISEKDVVLNVISKSGTTLETASAFRIFREFLENKYGFDEAQKRIYVTTSKNSGALSKIAKANNYKTFTIPSDIGGRFSICTPVGLFPMAVAGLDIDSFIEGLKFSQEKYLDKSIKYNDALKYAIARILIDKEIEILTSYNPKTLYFNEWWKQLFGESLGKDNKGIFPASTIYTTDLHSLGQFVQQGPRIMFETLINEKNKASDIEFKNDEDNFDDLNKYVGKSINELSDIAMQATIKAHTDGEVPNIIINIDKFTEKSIAELIFFFEIACSVNGELLEINPFDQPGVEEYKRNIIQMI